MKRIACLVVGLGLGGACQSSDKTKSTEAVSAAPVPKTTGSAAAAPGPVTAYAEDIKKLCNLVELAGLGAVPRGDRQVQSANWLAANLSSSESREFLVKIQPLEGEAKAVALETEAKRLGLTDCALAAEWRSPPPPPSRPPQ